MPSHSKIILLLAGVAALSLSACAEPNMFPDGYTYHGKSYKSATPPESDKFTPAERKAMGPEQAEQFRQSVYDLAEKLTTRAGLPPKSVYVQRPEKMTAFHANLDNDVRESLRHLGYSLADTPDGAYIFTYTASVIKPIGADGATPVAVAPGSPNVRLGLQVHDSLGETSKMLTEEAGDYYIQGAETLDVPSGIFSGVSMPTGSSGPGGNNN